MVSWQHGTEVKRDNVSSNDGFNLLSLKKEENIKTPKMFAVDMTDEQEREHIESLIVKKEKAAILKALQELT